MASQNGSIDIVKLLQIHKNVDRVEFILAASNGQVESVQALFQKGSIDPSMWKNLIRVSIVNGNLEIVKLQL